eukprot:PhF_6_TR20468/c0_g1_i1/m.29441
MTDVNSKLATLDLRLSEVSSMEEQLTRQLTYMKSAQLKYAHETKSAQSKMESLQQELEHMKEEISTFPWPEEMLALEAHLSSVYENKATYQGLLLELREAIHVMENNRRQLRESTQKQCLQYQREMQSLSGSVGAVHWKPPTNVHNVLYHVEEIASEAENMISASISHQGHATVDRQMITKRHQEANVNMGQRVKEMIQKKEAEVIALVHAFEREKDRLRQVYQATLNVNVENAFHMNRGTHIHAPIGGTDKAKVLRQKKTEDQHVVSTMQKDFDSMRAERAEILKMIKETEENHGSHSKSFTAAKEARADVLKGERKLKSTLMQQRDEMKAMIDDLQQAITDAALAKITSTSPAKGKSGK